MIYSIMRPLLFRLDAETAHRLTLTALHTAHGLGLARSADFTCRPRAVMGIEFPNPVGLAAGLDKNGEYLDALAALGFGFIEIGTVTPRPQPGNSRPRLFRIPEAQAIVNRMGFNNDGVDKLTENVRRCRYRGVLGINIGKNFDTPIERAADDYCACLRKVYPYASYVAVNISSPNTEGLRRLQNAQELGELLGVIKSGQRKLFEQYRKYVPLAVKIAPDLAADQVGEIAALLVKHEIDAVIATNTTLSRCGVERLSHAEEAGGLSGAPLTRQSTEVIRRLAAALQGALPIIGVGGIMNPGDALEKVRAGASLVQIYSGLVYRGPGLVRQTVAALCEDR